MSVDLRASFTGMSGDQAVLAQVSGGVGDTAMPARRCSDQAAAAAGEFTDDLAGGAATFGLSWWSGLTFFGECADLLADNLGSAVLVLGDVDATLGTSQLPGPADAGDQGPGPGRPG